jgi:hypothetical protein
MFVLLASKTPTILPCSLNRACYRSRPSSMANNEEIKFMGKRIDVKSIAPIVGTLYSPPFDQPCRPRERRQA